MYDAVELYVSKMCEEIRAEEKAKSMQRIAEMKADFDRHLTEEKAEAKAEAKRNSAKKLLSFGKNTHSEIAMATGLALSEIDSLALSVDL